ncbi:MAG: hypothetical protein Q9223_004549 [Gallowayella weberi]
MSWRFSRHRRLLRPRSQCSRYLSNVNFQPHNIASALALRPNQDQDNFTIEVFGSVRSIRKQKHCAFLELGDGSTVHNLQAVLNPDQAQGLSHGTSVALQGLWRPAPPGKTQSHELQAKEVTIIGTTDSERYPIQKKFQTAEFLRSIPHLRLRLPLQALLARMRSESEFLLAQYFRRQGFLRVQPPIVTSSDCEGAGEVFSLATASPNTGRYDEKAHGDTTFFRKPKFLTVSSQLHLEAYMQEHSKVWAFSPTFRAERSDTPRHVSEFWMVEVEMRTRSLEEIMDFAEDMLKSLVQGLRKSPLLDELVVANRSKENPHVEESVEDKESTLSRWNMLEERSWPRITYTQAIELLQASASSGESKFVYHPSWGTGLQLEHEKYIAVKVGQGQPVFVTDYPQTIKPFYMLPSVTENDDGAAGRVTAACFDLLLPEVCEVVGGSLREHRLQELELSMQTSDSELALSSSSDRAEIEKPAAPVNSGGNLDWYIDLRRFGSIPHGGFGLGFDRMLCYLTGIRNIKDVVPWPRFYGRCDC